MGTDRIVLGKRVGRKGGFYVWAAGNLGEEAEVLEVRAMRCTE